MRYTIRSFVNRRWSFAIKLIAPLLFLGLAWALSAETVKPPFVVSVVPTTSSPKASTISMAHKEPWTFYVVLTNVSNEPQTAWEEGNSWGYRVISFEVIAANGQKTVISKLAQVFGKNTPRTFFVKPGEQKIYEVRLNEEWSAHPGLTKADEMSITLKARYDTSPTPEAAKLKVWIGHVESKDYHLMLRQW